MSAVWLNGQFVDRDRARLSVFDAGLQHGVGLFETTSAGGGAVFRLDDHLARLADSARRLRLTDSLRAGPLAEAVRLTLERSGLNRARIRLTITGGDLNLLQSQRQSPADPTVLIVAQPATEYPAALFERGARVVIADGRLNPLDPDGGHKTLNYWFRLRALQDAAAKGCSEAVWFSVSNHLMSGSVSNVFLVKGGTLLTPLARGEEPQGGLPAPVIPGVTRRFIVEAAAGMGVGTGRQMLTVNDLLEADEVFLTNSSWGVLPVVAVEAEAIGDGVVGEITKRLRQRWLEESAGG